MIILILSVMMSLTQSIKFKFTVPTSKLQCFSDQLSLGTLVYGEVQASSKDFKYYLTEVHKEEEQFIDQKEQEDHIIFHHVMTLDGTIVLCFEVGEFSLPIKFKIRYDSGGEAQDYHQLALKGQAIPLNQTIREMEALQRDISRQQNSLISLESQRNNNFVDISSKVIGFTGVTFGLLLMVASCQVIYIKRYFAYKKLI